jgi:hypothetical protein
MDRRRGGSRTAFCGAQCAEHPLPVEIVGVHPDVRLQTSQEVRIGVRMVDDTAGDASDALLREL